MAQGDAQISIPNGPAPTTREVVGLTPIVPKAVNATFDGTGAAGAFLPCLVIAGKEGFEVARIPAPQVAAGASAEVSWFPRVGGGASTGPAAGIKFAANGVYGPVNSGVGLRINVTGANYRSDVNVGNYTVNLLGVNQLMQFINEGGNIDFRANGFGTNPAFPGIISLFAADSVNIEADGANGIFITNPNGPVTIESGSPIPAPAFRVDPDGSVHIRTGTAIIADL